MKFFNNFQIIRGDGLTQNLITMKFEIDPKFVEALRRLVIAATLCWLLLK